jgi:hypothetical protein
LGKGVEKVIIVLLSLANLYNINLIATTDICIAYNNAMSIFYNKIMQGDFIVKKFRASFMKLWLEVFLIFNINRYNVWEIQNLSSAKNSLSLKLYNIIDNIFTEWNDNPEAICIFEVTVARLATVRSGLDRGIFCRPLKKTRPYGPAPPNRSPVWLQ